MLKNGINKDLITIAIENNNTCVVEYLLECIYTCPRRKNHNHDNDKNSTTGGDCNSIIECCACGLSCFQNNCSQVISPTNNRKRIYCKRILKYPSSTNSSTSESIHHIEINIHNYVQKIEIKIEKELYTSGLKFLSIERVLYDKKYIFDCIFKILK